MIRELEIALLARLRGKDQAPPKPIIVTSESIIQQGGTPDPNQATTEIQVTNMMPEDWYNAKIFPSMNIWRTKHDSNPNYQRVGRLRRRINQTAGTMDSQIHPAPMISGYEISMLARFGEQITEMVEQVHRRLPPLGIGTVFRLQTKDGIIKVPFRQVQYSDISSKDDTTASDREFDVRLQYEFNTWAYVDDWHSDKIIKHIVTDIEDDVINTDAP